MTEKFGADLIVDSLINHKVDYIITHTAPYEVLA